MRSLLRSLSIVAICGLSLVTALAQCPARPGSETEVVNPLDLFSQNGVLTAAFTMGTAVDSLGYTHYCYRYKTPAGAVIESPTLRLNQGDTLNLTVKNRIISREPAGMQMDAPTGPKCADGGNMTLSSTNVHFHGLNVPPTCHQDDVLTTLIQPGSSGFNYGIQIPPNEPPGLYWYHPHVHGFTEFQVNGGATGALIVEGMSQVRPEVAGLTERVLIVRQQYLVPWIPGPYQLTLNYEGASTFRGPEPIITMQPGQQEFWRVANSTLQDFTPLQFWVNGVPQPLRLIALDGYPLPQSRLQDTILIPPAGRAEFIVDAPPPNTAATFVTLGYSTGPTGNPDLEQPLALVFLATSPAAKPKAPPAPLPPAKPLRPLKYADLAKQTPTAERKVFFSEEFGGTNGPIKFFITVDGEKPKVFEADEKPVITTKVGAIEDWTIENRALETHAFHIHQIHFMMLEEDGHAVAHQDMRDTIEVPFWEGAGHPYHSVKVRMDFRDPTTAGTFVFHCHILLHEDLGMMHKILVEP